MKHFKKEPVDNHEREANCHWSLVMDSGEYVEYLTEARAHQGMWDVMRDFFAGKEVFNPRAVLTREDFLRAG